MKTFLHVGCGPKRKNQTTRAFNSPDWAELRLDIDPDVSPDIIGTMTDMAAVQSGSVDAVFSSHNIEHLYAHEVPIALAEFKRVLNEDGFVVITCPDLKSVAALIAEDKLTVPAYTAPAGPITPLDILYGHRPQLAQGNLYMAHRCGFTQGVLDGTLRAAGFAAVATMARGFAPFFDLWALASVSARSEEIIRTLAGEHFPRPQLCFLDDFLKRILPMATITIDGKDYDLESLSAPAKAELTSLQFVDQELARLQLQAAALQTARNAYAAALKAHLHG